MSKNSSDSTLSKTRMTKQGVLIKLQPGESIAQEK